MDAYQTRQASIKLFQEASQVIDRAVCLGQLGDMVSYQNLMSQAFDMTAEARRLDALSHELYRYEWTEPECACVTPDQSCPACRLAAANNSTEIPF